MLFLQAQMQEAVTEVAENPVLTEVVEAANEMNLWDMATKGGWIMIILALLSILCVYIFVERLVVIRKASKVDPVFMDRIHDYVKTDELKSAINYCRVTNSPMSNMIEKGLERIDRPASEVQAALENAGNLEVAKNYLKQAASKKDCAEVNANRALVALAEGNTEEAETFVSRATSSPVYNELVGNLNVAKGNYAAAAASAT